MIYILKNRILIISCFFLVVFSNTISLAEEDIKLLDSSEPCANVQNPLSSYIDPERSTVGNEAAYLIEGFRHDRYPPRLNSTRPPCDIEEIKKWWAERQGT